MNLAAESHVDRSIDGPGDFIQTNIVGTFTLLQEALRHWRGLSPEKRAHFRLLHISTDEVFGSLGDEGLFTETSATRRIHPIPPARRRPTISCAPGARPMSCRPWSPTARTITAPIISRKS